MDENTTNRMSTPRKRGPGRPTKDPSEIASVLEPTKPTAPLPLGMICPCCGRGMTPRVSPGSGPERACACTLCGGQFRLVMAATGFGWLAKRV